METETGCSVITMAVEKQDAEVETTQQAKPRGWLPAGGRAHRSCKRGAPAPIPGGRETRKWGDARPPVPRGCHQPFLGGPLGPKRTTGTSCAAGQGEGGSPRPSCPLAPRQPLTFLHRFAGGSFPASGAAGQALGGSSPGEAAAAAAPAAGGTAALGAQTGAGGGGSGPSSRHGDGRARRPPGPGRPGSRLSAWPGRGLGGLPPPPAPERSGAGPRPPRSPAASPLARERPRRAALPRRRARPAATAKPRGAAPNAAGAAPRHRPARSDGDAAGGAPRSGTRLPLPPLPTGVLAPSPQATSPPSLQPSSLTSPAVPSPQPHGCPLPQPHGCPVLPTGVPTTTLALLTPTATLTPSPRPPCPPASHPAAALTSLPGATGPKAHGGATAPLSLAPPGEQKPHGASSSEKSPLAGPGITRAPGEVALGQPARRLHKPIRDGAELGWLGVARSHRGDDVAVSVGTFICKVRASNVRLVKPKLFTFQETGGLRGKELEVANGEDGG